MTDNKTKIPIRTLKRTRTEKTKESESEIIDLTGTVRKYKKKVVTTREESSSEEEVEHSACGTCAKSGPWALKCPNCPKILYCSAICRSQSQPIKHKSFCSEEKKHHVHVLVSTPDYIRMHVPQSWWKRQKSPIEEPLCHICLSIVPLASRIFCTAGHLACLDCLRHWNPMSGYTTWTCFMQTDNIEGVCRAPLLHESLSKLPPKDISTMNNATFDQVFKPEMEKVTDKASEKAIRCDCSFRFLVRGEGVIPCPGCQLEWCIVCLSKTHPGDTCQEVERRRKENEEKKSRAEDLQMLMKVTNGIVCKNPDCKIPGGAPIEKDGGCNSIQCSICKKHTCYLCGTFIENLNGGPYSHFGSIFFNDFKECMLYTDKNKSDNGNVRVNVDEQTRHDEEFARQLARENV